MIERQREWVRGRVFTPHEIQYCSERKAATQHYAGRWAAKEAVMKTLGTGWSRGISWCDIEVRNEIGGRPYLALSGGVLETSRRLGIEQILISISHCRCHAIAYALALGPVAEDK